MPPSTTIAEPLVHEASSEARYSAMLTMSSDLPKRPIGMRLKRVPFSAGSLKSHADSSGVSIGPGQIALERTPFGPNCTARDFVSAITAPLDAVYASCGTEQPTSAT